MRAAHELGVPALELCGGVRGERAQREAEELVDVERAGLVLLVVGAVLRLVGRALQHAAVDQELAPLVVAVAGEERVVEVEEGQAHARPEFNFEANCLEPALDADAEVLQAEQARGVARQASRR